MGISQTKTSTKQSAMATECKAFSSTSFQKMTRHSALSKAHYREILQRNPSTKPSVVDAESEKFPSTSFQQMTRLPREIRQTKPSIKAPIMTME